MLPMMAAWLTRSCHRRLRLSPCPAAISSGAVDLEGLLSLPSLAGAELVHDPDQPVRGVVRASLLGTATAPRHHLVLHRRRDRRGVGGRRSGPRRAVRARRRRCRRDRRGQRATRSAGGAGRPQPQRLPLLLAPKTVQAERIVTEVARRGARPAGRHPRAGRGGTPDPGRRRAGRRWRGGPVPATRRLPRRRGHGHDQRRQGARPGRF